MQHLGEETGARAHHITRVCRGDEQKRPTRRPDRYIVGRGGGNEVGDADFSDCAVVAGYESW